MPSHILIVDDDLIFREITASALEERFTISEADSGEAALAILGQQKVDIILLDINMAGMDGFATCRLLLNQQPELRVVFVSGNGSLESRIQAYDAGAADFICKPFNNEELLLKMDVLERVIHNAAALKQSLHHAATTAVSAIATSSELGSVIDMNRRALACNSLDSLLQMLVSTLLNRFELPASVQFRLPNIQKTLASDGRSSPLEAEMLANLSHDARHIFEYGRRLVFNYGAVIILIKNPPLDDEVKTGRLRDSVAVLAETVEARVHNLYQESIITEQRMAVQNAIAATHKLMQTIETDYKQHSSQSVALFDQLTVNMDQAMVTLGLLEHQETRLLGLIQAASQQAEAIYHVGLGLDSQFATVMDHLSTAIKTAPCEKHAFAEPVAPVGEDQSMILF